MAHSGFLSRARSIPTAALHAHARRHRKRFVVTGAPLSSPSIHAVFSANHMIVDLAGHSLGGAVAQLCALDLLQQACSAAGITCISFAAPVVGNPALAVYTQRRGWDASFINYLLPGM